MHPSYFYGRGRENRTELAVPLEESQDELVESDEDNDVKLDEREKWKLRVRDPLAHQDQVQEMVPPHRVPYTQPDPGTGMDSLQERLPVPDA